MNLDNIKQRTEVDKKLFTGLADLNVLAINPDAARIQEITGRDEVKESEYGSFADDGTAKLRLDIWLANAELGISPFKHTIWCEDRESISSKGSVQYINEAGVQTWGKVNPSENEKMAWFTRVPHRVAYVGETDLYNFLVAWLCYDQKVDNAPMLLDTPFSEIVNGNIEELTSLQNVLSERQVRMLTSVKDGKYQTVYPKVVTQAGSKYKTSYENELKRDREAGYPYKGDYQNSLVFQVYTGESVPTAPLSTTANVTDLLAKLK